MDRIVFGAFWGGTLTLIGNVLGAGLSAVLMRCVSKDFLSRMASSERLESVQLTLDRRGPLPIFLLRLNPLTSSDVVSYAAGLTRIPIPTIMFATGLGMAPLCYGQAWMAESLLDSFPLLLYPLAVACLLYAVMVVSVICRSFSSGIPMRYWSICFIAVALATNGIAQDIARSVVFDGRRDVDLMANVPSDRLVELTAKMQTALAIDSSWFLKALEASKPGEPLAYDVRIGLTEAEYSEYLSMVGKAKVSKVGESWIEMHSISSGVYSLRGSPVLPMLNEIRIDVNRDEITTPFGVLKVSKTINAPDSTALGKWQGTQWSLEQPSRDPRPKLVQFSLGRRTEDEKNLLILRVRAIDEEKQKTISSMVILYFDPE